MDSADKAAQARYKKYLEAELEAAATYTSMAEIERDPSRTEIFEDLVKAEMRHASRWAEKLGMDVSKLEPAKPDMQGRLYRVGARIFGTNRILPWLLRGEAKDIMAYASDPEARDFAAEERHHEQILRTLAYGREPLERLRSERGHRFSNGGSLRAAVLGANDGLVSNFSLVMGVAGGTEDPKFVLLAGVAGLLAGAFSMAAGEYVSMRSQRDIYEYQIMVEEAELRDWPEEEEEELVLIYRAKGFSREDAEGIAKQIMSNPQVALDTMAREELGLDPSQLGSPWGAAISSFIAFAIGAVIPILPYIFDAGSLAFVLSGAFGAAALLIVGGSIAVLTNRNIAWGASRMLLAGGTAAAVTFGVGHLIGVSLLG